MWWLQELAAISADAAVRATVFRVRGDCLHVSPDAADSSSSSSTLFTATYREGGLGAWAGMCTWAFTCLRTK